MIKPFGTRILIKPEEKKTVLVSDKGSLCEYGTVLAVGDEVKKVKVGDVVGFLVWGVESLEIDGIKSYFVDETSDFVLCTITNENTQQ